LRTASAATRKGRLQDIILLTSLKNANYEVTSLTSNASDTRHKPVCPCRHVVVPQAFINFTEILVLVITAARSFNSHFRLLFPLISNV